MRACRLGLGLLLLCTSAPATAQTLGVIDFPNSGKKAAQAPFIRGVMLLHSFEYEEAADAFRSAQKADPGFALAYWGEAMTYTHPLWNQQDVPAARAALERLAPTAEGRRARAATEREKLYLEATEALYFTDAGKAKRDTLYSRVLERLVEAYPRDREARAFYALSLMGLSQSVRNIPTYMRAGAIAEALYRENPKHPGALHYIIHAFDDPIHAPLGLYAAREYSRIAADAAHAQHMTTHIFLALGMWPETISQNAVASGDSARWTPGHYTAWLDYGLLQRGQYARARAILERTHANLGTTPRPGQLSYLLNMRAHYLVGTGRWDDPLAQWTIAVPAGATVQRAMDLYARGAGRLAAGDAAGAENALRQLNEIAAAGDPGARAGAGPHVPGILALQLQARLAWSRAERDRAFELLRTAAEREDALPLEFGPPDIVKPTWELLGELLLAADKPAEAQRAFQRALELAPGRSLSLLGLSRAARQAGDAAVADAALARLADNWRDADAEVPGLAEVRRERAGTR